MLSWRVFQRVLPLNDSDSTAYDAVLLLQVCRGSSFQDHVSHTFSHEIPIQSTDSCYLMTYIFQSSTSVDI